MPYWLSFVFPCCCLLELIFLAAKNRRRARRELGGFVFIHVRSESLACSELNSSANLAEMQL
jgi:hypothetical protein